MDGMDGMDAGAGEHAGHNHSDHAAMASPSPMDMAGHDSHSAVGRNPDGSYFYTHGAFTGHVVPGTFFLVSAGRQGRRAAAPPPAPASAASRARLLAHPPPPPALRNLAQLWGLWWTIALYTNYLKATAAKKPFAARSWWLVPGGPALLQRLPLEPLVKIVLPFFGALGELWLGHDHYQ